MDNALPPTESILRLLTMLVRIPSRAGEDDLKPVLECVEHWFSNHSLTYQRIQSIDGAPMGLYAEVRGGRPMREGRPRRHFILNATLDTAGFGDTASWTYPPTEATDVGGWMYGRGSGDSKAGAAIFAHLLAAFAARTEDYSGRLGLLFDLEEHTGTFAGARRYFESDLTLRPDGVLIGYPGIDRIVVGSRGFLRARVTVHGVAAHSGGTTQRGLNAVFRAIRLVDALDAIVLPVASSGHFGRPPQLTVTSLHGGEGYSQVPDRCELTVDIRLTPDFDADAARRVIADVIARHDDHYATALSTSVEWIPGWPAYQVVDGHPMIVALREAASGVLGRELPCAVVGPSNIGNYLATRNIPALCGFGVRAQNLHAANEGIELATVAPVYRIYGQALARLLD